MRWGVVLVACVVVLSFILYYNFTGNVVYSEQSVNVTKVVDGDTIDSSLGKIRLLGINTPEKKQPYYEEARDNLKSLIEGKVVEIRSSGRDKYDRILAYVYLDGKLINEEQLSRGLATLYYYDRDYNFNEMKKSEEGARDSGVGLWKKSLSFGCLSYLDGGKCNNQEEIVLNNSCGVLNVIIKDDANHIYDEKIENGLWQKNFSCIWNDAGDTIYIRDSSGLILFYRY